MKSAWGSLQDGQAKVGKLGRSMISVEGKNYEDHDGDAV